MVKTMDASGRLGIIGIRATAKDVDQALKGTHAAALVCLRHPRLWKPFIRIRSVLGGG
jgi:hypothetical protein